MANYDGLTRNSWTGTWSPSAEHPIVLDTEIRGGLRFVSGDSADRLEDITGQRLQEGMLAYLKSGYGSFQGDTYYKYSLLVGESRDTSTGDMPNASGNWSPVSFGGSDSAGIQLAEGSGINLRDSDGFTVISLEDTGVVSGTYGSSDSIPILTIDEKGRVTSATEIGLTDSSYKYSLSGTSFTVSHEGIDTLSNFYVLDPNGNEVGVIFDVSDSDLSIDSIVDLTGHDLYVVTL